MSRIDGARNSGLYCSFCGDGRNGACRLVAGGHGGFVCNRCASIDIGMSDEGDLAPKMLLPVVARVLGWLCARLGKPGVCNFQLAEVLR